MVEPRFKIYLIDEFSLNVSENSPIGYILEVDLEY